jgi:hypothetical protein
MLLGLQHAHTKKALITVLFISIRSDNNQAIDSFTRSRNSLPGLK